jgi:hypothetical protein
MARLTTHIKARDIPREEITRQDDFLEGRIDQLMFYAKQLRSLSRTLVFLLFNNFVLVIALGLKTEKFAGPLPKYIDLIYLLIILFVFLAGFYILYRFNNTRKKGMSLYAEITDDIDWSKKRREFIHCPPIKARTSIKDFLHATDLPFTSGVNGQAIYVLGFVLMALVSLIIMVKF